ncbi:MAG: hypothetical protein JWO80_6522 [Bryobacterales bacterium]|nr:hypothetical protein [Bryobacterales bacterium]
MKQIVGLIITACLSGGFSLDARDGAGQNATSEKGYLVYVGTYTRQGSKGIYAYRFSPGNGKLSPLGLVAETENPSFLATGPSGRFLYAVNEIGNYEGKNAGSVSAFSLDSSTGSLIFLNKVTTRGSIFCHLVVDKTGKCLVVANYGSGSVAAFPIKPDGSLGEASAFVQHGGSGVNARQKGPHAHMVQLSEDNRFILVPDLGADQVITYRLNPAKGTLTAEPNPTRGAPGLGPRHLAFDPQGKFDYLINEMGSAVTAFRYKSSGGSLTPLQTISTLPKEFTGTNNSAEIEVHPNGKFVYVSNRGDDSIAMFSADAKTGTLTLTGRVPTGGKTPRNFAIDPTGGYLLAANQDSGSIITFRIDKNTGELTPTGEQVSIPQPVCILLMRQR